MPRRWFGTWGRYRTLLLVSALAALAYFMRCLHLFDPSHYFVLRADSHFFHWVARGILAGEPPPSAPWANDVYTLQSGLAYPLAWVARAVSSVFGVPLAEALDLASRFLPPFIAVVTLAIVYVAVAKILGRRVAVLSALAWALLLQAVLFGAAGYLDRDGQSTLLLLAGVVLFYFSGEWRLRLRGRDFGWLASAAGVLVIEGLLYAGWSFIGAALLLVALVAYSLSRWLLAYLDCPKSEGGVCRRLAVALRDGNWRPLGLIVIVNVLVIVLHPEGGRWIGLIGDMVRSLGESDIAEMRGLTVPDFLVYHLFLLPAVVGLYLAAKQRSGGLILFASWFLSYLVVGLFASRALMYAAPAFCVLAGVGAVFIWDWAKGGQFEHLKKLGTALLLLLCLVVSLALAAGLGWNQVIAVDTEWRDALRYLREETPQKSIVMTQWTWGYRILDLGERRPLVDNGYYFRSDAQLRDIGLAYAAREPSQAAAVMEKWRADYLVFSTLDEDVASTILGWADLDEGADEFPEDSLYSLSLNGEFESGGGLEVAHRSSPDGEVVILRLVEDEADGGS